jgi:integrase
MAQPKHRAVRGTGGVHQRASDGLWAATADLGRDRLTGKRLRKVFYGKTQREALGKRSAWARDYDDGLAQVKTAEHAFTVADWIDYWLEQKIRQEREPTTYALYMLAARLHIKPGVGAVPLRELEVEHVEEWLRRMEHAGVGLRMRQVSLIRLRTALNFGLQRRQQTGLKYNPAALVAMPTGPRRPKVPPPDLAQVRALLDAARGDRLEAILTVGLALGLRKGEILGLRWEDIDLDNRTVVVRRRVNRLSGPGLIVRQGNKMNPDASVTVAMPVLLVPVLKQHRQRQAAERIAAGTRWRGEPAAVDGKPAGYVFTSTVGTLLEPRNMDRSFHRWREAAGLDGKAFHQLRHDCASLLLAQGVPMYAVSQILRHSSPAITARFYAHLTPELQRGAADMMDQVLQPILDQKSVVGVSGGL